MGDNRFYRGRKAIEFIENGQKLTSYALSAHSSIVCGSNAYLCDPEEVDANGNFTCTVRRGPGKTDYRVRVTPSYAVECPCRHYEELMRPCSHAVAGIKAASTLVKLPQYQDVMDHRLLGIVWHLGTLRAQHTGVIKRVSLAGHARKPLSAEDARQAGPQAE